MNAPAARLEVAACTSYRVSGGELAVTVRTPARKGAFPRIEYRLNGMRIDRTNALRKMEGRA